MLMLRIAGALSLSFPAELSGDAFFSMIFFLFILYAAFAAGVLR